MDDSQLLKGILEGCVLGIISRGETYGYEIITSLYQYGFEDVGEGTLYPILTRLDKNGYIVCRKAKSPLGPVRKYYSISEEGVKRLMGFAGDYRRMKVCTDRILADSGVNIEDEERKVGE